MFKLENYKTAEEWHTAWTAIRLWVLTAENAAPRTASWRTLKANGFLANNISFFKKNKKQNSFRVRGSAVTHLQNPRPPNPHTQRHTDMQLLWFHTLHNIFQFPSRSKNTLSAGQVHFMSQYEAADVTATEATHNRHLNSTQPTWVGYIRATLSPKSFLKQNLCWTSVQLSHPITILHMLQQKQALSTEY